MPAARSAAPSNGRRKRRAEQWLYKIRLRGNLAPLPLPAMRGGADDLVRARDLDLDVGGTIAGRDETESE